LRVSFFLFTFKEKQTSMKYLLFILSSIFILSLYSCTTENDECRCYERALEGKEMSEDCEQYVKGLTEEDLKEKSNDCFVKNIEDLSGASGL